MTLFKSFFILCFLTGSLLMAQNKNENKSNGKEAAKTYTQEEFNKELEEQVRKKLERFRPKNIVEVSRELLLKEKKLSLKEVEMKDRERQLKINEEQLSQKIKEFQQQQQKLISCIDKNDQDKSKRVEHMVQVISGMKPATAAQVISVQDSDISVKILGRLPAAKVSKIFNSLDKEISARLQKQYMNMKK